jgi:hypothetical protein
MRRGSAVYEAGSNREGRGATRHGLPVRNGCGVASLHAFRGLCVARAGRVNWCTGQSQLGDAAGRQARHWLPHSVIIRSDCLGARSLEGVMRAFLSDSRAPLVSRSMLRELPSKSFLEKLYRLPCVQEDPGR